MNVDAKEIAKKLDEYLATVTLEQLNADLKKAGQGFYAYKVPEIKKECCVCGTTKDIHKDGAYGYRCSSEDCMIF